MSLFSEQVTRLLNGLKGAKTAIEDKNGTVKLSGSSPTIEEIVTGIGTISVCNLMGASMPYLSFVNIKHTIQGSNLQDSPSSITVGSVGFRDIQLSFETLSLTDSFVKS